MSQAQERVQKRDDKVQTPIIFRIFGVDAGRYADELWQFFCTCTVVFPLKYWSR